ncbi:Histone deacetylase hda1, partial [Massospora cicadina]
MSGHKRTSPGGSVANPTPNKSSKPTSSRPASQQRNLQRRTASNTKGTNLGVRTDLHQNGLNDLLQLELVRSVALVANEGLLDMPKGLSSSLASDKLIDTFGDYYALLNHVKCANLCPFLFDMGSYFTLFEKIAGSELQRAFYESAQVLCISLHRATDGAVSGLASEVGSGEALGRNVNCPFPADEFSSNDLLYAFQHLVLPIALEFQPNVVL